MKQLILFFALIINTSGINAQHTIKGKIINTNNHPIAYATIAIMGTNKGCYSDSNGYFELISNKDSLSISCIGYVSQQISLTDCSETLLITLQKDKVAIKEVVVAPQKRTLKKVKDQDRIACSACLSKGTEIVSFIPIRKGSTLNNLTFYCQRTRTKRIVGLRLYTYNYKNEPEEILMNEDLVVEIAPFSNKISFDVKQMNIVVPQNGLFAGLVFIDTNTLEIKKKDKTNPYVYLSTKHLIKQTYMRNYNTEFYILNFPCSLNRKGINNLQCSYSYY